MARLGTVALNALLAIGGGLLVAWLVLNTLMGCGEPGGWCWPFEWWH